MVRVIPQKCTLKSQYSTRTPKQIPKLNFQSVLVLHGQTAFWIIRDHVRLITCDPKNRPHWAKAVQLLVCIFVHGHGSGQTAIL